MKIVLKIAKTELLNMFCSPIAWVVLIIFAIQVGFVYTGIFDNVFSRQLLHYANWDLSRNLFSLDDSSVFPKVQQYLFLYLPLVTMGLISQEISSGTIKLLYSSPVTISKIVWGKFLAMMVYSAALTGVLFIEVIFSIFTVPHFDLPAILSGILGIYLLICTYSAIGLFLSALISSQVVVAISTFATLAILNYIGTFGQETPFLRDITFWLSIKGRATNMTLGLISSEDILYFIIVSGMFIALTISYLNFGSKRVSALKQSLIYFTILALTTGLGALSFQPKLMYYYDATAMKSMSLKKENQTILEKMDGGVTITTYVNLFDNYAVNALPQNELTDRKFFQDYIRFKPDIKMKYVYYYNNPAINDMSQLKSVARKLAITDRADINDFLSPEEIKRKIDLSSENYRFVRLIERDNGKKTWLRLFNDMQVVPGEPEIMAAFMRLSMPLPKVGFLSGHGERSINTTLNKDYYYFAQAKNYRHALTNQGFDVGSVILNQQRNNLSRLSILVIADIQQPLKEWEIRQINSFIDSGGNLLIAGDGGDNENLNKIVKALGVKVNNGILIQPQTDELPNQITAHVEAEAVKLDSSFYWMHQGNQNIILNGATSLNVVSGKKQFSITPILVTDSQNSWMVKDKKSIDLNNLKPAPSIGQITKQYLLAIALTRKINKKEQRIAIFSDADFLSTGELKNHKTGSPSYNPDFIGNIFKWFSYGKIPIDASRKIGRDNNFNFTSSGIKPMHLFFWVGIPLILLGIAGTILLIRRKR